MTRRSSRAAALVLGTLAACASPGDALRDTATPDPGGDTAPDSCGPGDVYFSDILLGG